jgi:hypothetical protein
MGWVYEKEKVDMGTAKDVKTCLCFSLPVSNA